MLVLKRKVDEKIIIGDDITITVSKIESNAVKLVITAPKGVPIDREEVRILKDIEAKLNSK
jgi:carbon storage regulator